MSKLTWTDWLRSGMVVLAVWWILIFFIISGLIYVEKQFACSLNAFDVNPLCISISHDRVISSGNKRVL